MEFRYKPEILDALIAEAEDDDLITMTGKEFRELTDGLRKKGKGRRPIELDEDKFNQVVRRWQGGEITARAAMQELDLKPNTFYRRVKERNQEMDEIRRELKMAAREEKEELRELRKQVKAEAREVKKAAKEAAREAAEEAGETISARKMEKEILREKAAAELDHKKELRELKKAVEAEAKAYKAEEAAGTDVAEEIAGDAAEIIETVAE